MPTVHVDARQFSGVTPGVVAVPSYAKVFFTPFAPYHVNDGSGDYEVSAETLKVPLVNGVADVVLPETPDLQGVWVQFRSVKGLEQKDRWLVAIPGTDCNLFDLPHLDPDSLDPLAPPSPAWVAQLAAEVTRATGAEQTNATAIAAETTRATGVEATKVSTSTYTAGLALKQDAASLSTDTAPHVSDGTALDLAVAAKIRAVGDPVYAPIGSTGSALSDVAAVASVDAALVVSKHNPVDATSGPRTMTLAAASAASKMVSFEKTDSTANPVNVTVANLRGSAGSLSLAFQRETLLLASKADGSWWPVAGHRTKASLDAAYVAATSLDIDGTLAANSDARVATQKATKTYVDQIIAAQDAMVFKGVIDASANPNYPAADRGHTYRISVAGKIGGAAGVVVEVGDLALCLTDGTAAGTQAAVGANWSVIQTNLDGAVIGPASAVSADFATFSGISGKVIQDSGLSLDVDGTLAANSDTRIPSQKAVKTAVAAQIPKSLVDAKGDVLIGTADDTPARLPVGTNGQRLTADSTKASGLRYADASRSSARRMTSGLYYGPGVHVPTTSSYTLNIVAAIPMMIPYDMTVDRIACEVTTAVATSVVRLGIYANDPATDTPVGAALIIDAGTIDSSTTGVKEITISQALTAGTYWLVAVPQVATGVALRSIGNTSDPLIGQTSINTSANLGVNTLQLNTTAGALPATGPVLVGRSVLGPKVQVRAA